MINVFFSSFFYCLTISGYMWFISDDESVCVRFWNKNQALPMSENLRMILNWLEFGEILSLIPVVGCLRQCWPSSTERGWERVKKEFLGERIKAWAVGSLRGSFEVAPTIRLGPGGWLRLLRLRTAQCSSSSRKHTDSPPFLTIPELSQLQKEFLIWIVHLTFE